MYERFTDRARQVLVVANQEAQRRKHEYVGTEHFLLALLDESSGVAAQVLVNRTLDRRIIKQAVEKLIQNGSDTLSLAKIPPTRRAKKVIEYALDECRSLKQELVGTEHILLGLLREQEGVASMVLTNFGLTLETVRAEIKFALGRAGDSGDRQDTALPGTEPIEEESARVVGQPGVCRKCGQPRIVRVIWNYVHLFDKNLEDIAAGKAILGSRNHEPVPAWVCLQCAPAWSEVHRLGLEDHELQLTKESAVDSANFEEAVKLRDAQIELRRQQHALIEELLGKP